LAGANAFVAGNAIFAQPDPLGAAAALRLSITSALALHSAQTDKAPA
jgi:hypothetical protein